MSDSQTSPGTTVISLGAASGVTIVDMDHPEREYDAPGGEKPAAPRVKRKYTRRHQDKQRHEAHQDKHEEPSDGEG